MTNFDDNTMFRVAYDNSPIDDAPRVDGFDISRTVLDDYPAPYPHKNPEGTFVRLPIRLVFNECIGLGLEIGPYDFSEVDIHMLRQAIAGFELQRRQMPNAKSENEVEDCAAKFDYCRRVDGTKYPIERRSAK
ncbi:hypothetical protein [Mycobacterium sp. AZCC_0083]|uniref:hypothetical protein n=1 Tax=Mycobacterium sp. AZCC_0083 TaxID=2735882 RepID=UPI00161E7960|nr:hypothetical protein [Mycobacterium sp. AZCC_0083]MBB5161593.1 hypothetical protein [Mycobacterium sp. AZCC_0083]